MPVVVVDNASQDNTCELVRRRASVKLIANSSNRGFAGAVNQGVAALETELILLLNPDVELQTSMDAWTTACTARTGGLATGKLLDERGQRPNWLHAAALSDATDSRFSKCWASTGCFPGIPSNRRYRCLDLDLSATRRSRAAARRFSDVPARSVAAVGRF